MYVLIVYDISVERVTKVRKCLKRYLNWRQNSVFEGELTEAQIETVKSYLQKNQFAKSLTIGLATLFFTQTILNIASMIGLIPLSGDILPFFSQGGTALIVNMFELGLLLQLTKYRV